MLKNQRKQLLTKMGAHQTNKASSCKPNCKSRAQEETGNSKMLNQETYFVFHILFEYLSSRVILIINLATGWNDPPKCIFFYFKKCFKEKKKQKTQSSPALCPRIDTSILCELPSNDTSFPKEQQEILQSSCPYFLFFARETCMNHQPDQSCQKLLGDMLAWAFLCGDLEVPPLRWKKQRELL